MKLKTLLSEAYGDTIFVQPNEVDEHTGKLLRSYSNTPGGFILREIMHLRSLEGVPKKVGRFVVNRTSITSLEFGPEECTSGQYFIFDSKLISLKYAAKKVVGEVSITGNNVSSLSGVGRDYFIGVGQQLNIGNNIDSSVLGILLIKTKVDVKNKTFLLWFPPSYSPAFHAQQILTKHLKGDRDINDCQEELIENDLKEFAKL